MDAALPINEAQSFPLARGAQGAGGPRLILGIDPGVSGAMALYDPAEGALEVTDTPVLFRNVGKTKRRIIDAYQVARFIDERSSEIAVVYIEQVGVRPQEGAVGAFSFGEGFGLLKGICIANFLRVETVTPQAWKRAMAVKGDKDQSRARASVLFPRAVGAWPLKKHDGRAEAALIALYGAQSQGGLV